MIGNGEILSYCNADTTLFHTSCTALVQPKNDTGEKQMAANKIKSLLRFLSISTDIWLPGDCSRFGFGFSVLNFNIANRRESRRWGKSAFRAEQSLRHLEMMAFSLYVVPGTLEKLMEEALHGMPIEFQINIKHLNPSQFIH